MTNSVKFLPNRSQILNWSIICGSVLLCLLLSLNRLPGMELFGVGPNWLLIWVVSWSLKRTVFQGVVAGLALGLMEDAIAHSYPSHLISLAIVGFFTARFQRQRYLNEDLISVMLIVFGMVIVAETMTAIQYSFHGWRSLSDLWLDYQRIVLSSAILSSLYAPILYYPLHRCWKQK